MNDNELDDMLNQWVAPPARAGLRERVRAGFLAKREAPRRWLRWPAWNAGKGLFAGAAAGIAVFLLVIAQAFPQVLNLGSSSPALRFPYFVMSDVVTYADDGSPRLEAHLVSYSYKGTEIVLDERQPDSPVQQFVMNFHIGIHKLLLQYTPGLALPESSAKDAWFSAYVRSGCVDKGETAIGHETILNHPTTQVQQTYPDGWKGTAWRAPDLGCFTLRSRTEAPVPGGGYRVTKQRDAQQVAFRRPEGGWK